MSSLRLVLPAALALALSACSGSGGGLGNILGGGNPLQCDPGTQVQLASPQANQSGVPSNIGQITIVASGNTNNLYDTHDQWNLYLTPSYSGAPIQGAQLQLVDGHTLNHPYASDFYYGSSIPNLTPGTTWYVTLQQQGVNCSGMLLGSFST
jgi:hypothetical protein